MSRVLENFFIEKHKNVGYIHLMQPTNCLFYLLYLFGPMISD